MWRFKGGEQAALARWQAFKDKGLNGYARRRNNAADIDGVSRMSAYIHYGMISPMRIAREAAEVGTKSADKYLDELLVFREHPWHHILPPMSPMVSTIFPNGPASRGVPPPMTRAPPNTRCVTSNEALCTTPCGRPANGRSCATASCTTTSA